MSTKKEKDSKPAVRPSAPKSDISGELATLKEKISDLNTENEALAARIVEMETVAAAKPAAAEPSDRPALIDRIRSLEDIWIKNEAQIADLSKHSAESDAKAWQARIAVLEKFLSEIQRTGTVDYGAIAATLQK